MGFYYSKMKKEEEVLRANTARTKSHLLILSACLCDDVVERYTFELLSCLRFTHLLRRQHDMWTSSNIFGEKKINSLCFQQEEVLSSRGKRGVLPSAPLALLNSP